MFTFLSSLLGSLASRIHRKSDSAPRTPTERKPLPESEFIVEVTETGIINHRPEGRTESVLFEDLAAVVIETNDTGPWGTDIWWVLLGQGPESGCVYPGGATGEGEALTALQRLPGFDDTAVIQAMSSCENARFLCWQKEWTRSPAAAAPDGQIPGSGA